MKYLTPHETALKRLNLKKGDKVKVISKAESYKLGWDDAWVPPMDRFVNRICEVDKIDNFAIGVRIKHPEQNWFYWFPAFCLEKVRE